MTDMGVSYSDIAEIIRIIDGSSCEELVIETDEFKLVIRRHGSARESNSQAPFSSPAAVEGGPKKIGTEPVAWQPDPSPTSHEVLAAMTGTFFRASSPEAEPYVQLGSMVAPGDPLGLIEVMKLFTTIVAKVSGKVTFIGAESGELVEFGRTLFLIEPIELREDSSITRA